MIHMSKFFSDLSEMIKAFENTGCLYISWARSIFRMHLAYVSQNQAESGMGWGRRYRQWPNWSDLG